MLQQVHGHKPRPKRHCRPTEAQTETDAEADLLIHNGPADHHADPERFVTSRSYIMDIGGAESEKGGGERLVAYRVVLRRRTAGQEDYEPVFVIADHPHGVEVGMGVFVLRPFEAGAFLMPYQGTARLTKEEVDSRGCHDDVIDCPRRTWWEQNLAVHYAEEMDEAFYRTHLSISFPPRPSHRAVFLPSFEYLNDFVDLAPTPTAAVDEFGGLYAIRDMQVGSEILLDYYGGGGGSEAAQQGGGSSAKAQRSRTEGKGVGGDQAKRGRDWRQRGIKTSKEVRLNYEFEYVPDPETGRPMQMIWVQED